MTDLQRGFLGCLAAGLLWIGGRISVDVERHQRPIALCPNYDTLIVRHQMKSTGWPDSTLHTHTYAVRLDTIPACLLQREGTK